MKRGTGDERASSGDQRQARHVRRTTPRAAGAVRQAARRHTRARAARAPARQEVHRTASIPTRGNQLLFINIFIS